MWVYLDKELISRAITAVFGTEGFCTESKETRFPLLSGSGCLLRQYDSEHWLHSNISHWGGQSDCIEVRKFSLHTINLGSIPDIPYDTLRNTRSDS